MQRIIGTEVEYGISSPSDPTANPILTSTQAVLAYAAAAGIQRAKRTRWDYEVESPLRDARGFDLSRSAGPPPMVDADEVGAANMILTNGARLYVDHAHPEYSAPECTDPMDAVIWDKAGERVMEAAARHVASVPGAAKLQLYKNNVDGKGASYGSHENYLMSRQTPFSAVIAGLTPLPGVAPGDHRLRAGRASARRATSPASSCRSARTTSRSRSAWRRRSSAASSTPATNRTPTPTSTGGCTSSSATRTSPRPRHTSRSAPRHWCST